MAGLVSSYTPPKPFKCTETYTAGTDKKGKPITKKCINKAKDMQEEIDISAIVSALYKLGEYVDSINAKVTSLSSTFSLIDSDVIYVDGETISNLSVNCIDDLGENLKSSTEGIAGVQSTAISTYEQLQTAEDNIAKNNCHFS